MMRTNTQRARLAVAVMLMAAIVGCGSARSAGSATPSPASAGSSGHPFEGTFYPSQGHTHLSPGEPDDFVYSSNPPTSGPHREIFNDAFISPTPLPSYVQVHLIEHGNVLVQYNCKCPDVVAALTAIAVSYDRHLIPANQLQPTAADAQNAQEQGLGVIVAPYPHMKSVIALTAWTRLATLNKVEMQKIDSFINTYLHNGANASQ